MIGRADWWLTAAGSFLATVVALGLVIGWAA